VSTIRTFMLDELELGDRVAASLLAQSESPLSYRPGLAQLFQSLLEAALTSQIDDEDLKEDR